MLKKLITVAVLSSLFSVFSITIQAQNHKRAVLDTVKLQIENKVEVVFAFKDTQDARIFLGCTFGAIRNQLMKFQDSISFKSYHISYEKPLNIKLSQMKPIRKVHNYMDKSFWVKYNNQLEITATELYLKINFNQMNELDSLFIDRNVEKVLDTISFSKYLTRNYHYTIRNDSLFHHHYFDSWTSDHSTIFVSLLGAGVGTYKNEFNTNISLGADLVYVKKGQLLRSYYASYDIQFFFNKEGKQELNNFASIGIRSPFRGMGAKREWGGIELGYLVNRSGDIFEKNTFRLGLAWQINFLELSFQLYSTNKFEELNPGIRVFVRLEGETK
jgi:hypothetical protein